LVDTGSADVVVDPGLYVPGPASQDLNRSYFIRYRLKQWQRHQQCKRSISLRHGSANHDTFWQLQGEIYSDQVTLGSLTADNQLVGSVANSSASLTFPHQGIVGFAGQRFSGFNSTPLFHTLCNQRRVSQCRFGLALNINGSGTQVLGDLDTFLYDGSLSIAPILSEWFLAGDIAVGGNILQRDALIELDSGTATVIG